MRQNKFVRSENGRWRLSLFVFLLIVGMTPLLAFAGPEDDFKEGTRLYNRGDLIKGMELLKRAASAGHAPAQVSLGYILDYSEDNDGAVQMYEAAAEQGDPGGEFGLGHMYAKGEGVEKDGDMAIYWFTKAGEQGYLQAMRVLFTIYYDGAFGLDPDMEYADHWAEQMVAAGAEDPRKARKQKKKR